jgi:hypothetical protein
MSLLVIHHRQNLLEQLKHGDLRSSGILRSVEW